MKDLELEFSIDLVEQEEAKNTRFFYAVVYGAELQSPKPVVAVTSMIKS